MMRVRVGTVPRFSLPLFLPSAVCLCKMSTAPPGPLIPKFVPVEQSSITSVSKPDGLKFSVISYNILAQAYVKSAAFPHSPASCLKWKTRSQMVLAVLKNLGSDFLCLQEVDEYDSFYKSNMEDIGYSSIYIQRTGKKRDGCGIFYKNNSAELVLEEKIDYNDLVNSVNDSLSPTVNKDGDFGLEGTSGPELENIKKTQEDRGDPNDPHVRLKRDCVGIMAVFKLKDPLCHHVIMANTHIYWDPNWVDVKLAQAKYLLSRLSQFKTTVSHKLDCMPPPIIVCGDFNSTPGDQVYQYLVSGTSSGNLAEDSDESLLPLCSFYASVRGEPQFTNCTPGFTGTLDYIFFSSPSGDMDIIKPVSYLQLPQPESSDVIGGLPNYHHPSDHLPIGAEFEFLQ